MLFSGIAVAVKSQALYWCNLWYCVALPLPISHYFTTMESGVPQTSLKPMRLTPFLDPKIQTFLTDFPDNIPDANPLPVPTPLSTFNKTFLALDIQQNIP